MWLWLCGICFGQSQLDYNFQCSPSVWRDFKMWARKNKDVSLWCLEGRVGLLWAAAAGKPGMSWLGRGGVPWSCRAAQLARTVGCPFFSSTGWCGWEFWTRDSRRDTPQFSFCHLFGADGNCPARFVSLNSGNTMRCIPLRLSKFHLRRGSGRVVPASGGHRGDRFSIVARWLLSDPPVLHVQLSSSWGALKTSVCVVCRNGKTGFWPRLCSSQLKQFCLSELWVSYLCLPQRQVEKNQQATVNPGLSAWIVLISGWSTPPDCSVDRESWGDQRSLRACSCCSQLGIRLCRSKCYQLQNGHIKKI